MEIKMNLFGWVHGIGHVRPFPRTVFFMKLDICSLTIILS